MLNDLIMNQPGGEEWRQTKIRYAFDCRWHSICPGQNNHVHMYAVSTPTQVMTYWCGIKHCRLTIPVTGLHSHKTSLFPTFFLAKTYKQTGEPWTPEVGHPSTRPLSQGTHHHFRPSCPSQLVLYAQENQRFTYLEDKKRENMVSGCPWNIQMLLIFISQVIPTSWHLVRRFLTY